MLEERPFYATDCRALLQSLAGALQSREEHWRALPTATRAAVAFARRIAETKTASADERRLAEEAARVLEPYAGQDELPYSEVVRLAEDANRLLSAARSLRDSTRKGSLWNALHGTVEQHTGVAVAGIQLICENLSGVLEALAALPNGEGLRSAAAIQEALQGISSGQLALSSLTRLSRAVQGAVEVLPPAVRRPGRQVPATLGGTRHFRIAVVEDEAVWRRFVLRAIETVRERLGPGFTVDAECFGNVQEAREALLPRRTEIPTLSSKQSDAPTVQPLAVVDMGLPADPADADSVRAGRTTPDRANGHALLRELRAYRANIPAIILTTPPYLLDDQLRAGEQGIQDYDYLLKGPDREARLVTALLRRIERAQAHRIELRLLPQGTVQIDGIPIRLGEMAFRTFYALCELCRLRHRAHTPEEILDQLDETFGEVYDYKRSPRTTWEAAKVLARRRSGHWWRPEWVEEIANLMRLWAAQKEAGGGDLLRALAGLRARYDAQLWHNGRVLLDYYREAHPEEGPWAKPTGWTPEREECLAAGFEAAFGGLVLQEREDYDLSNIEKHINELRNSIHAAFNLTHRFIEPRTELLVRRLVNGRYGYRVLGQIVFPELEEVDLDREGDDESEATVIRRPEDCPCTVLVVENKQSTRERILTLLEGARFQVQTATCLEEAVAKARLYRPDLLCLDLHLPATQEEFQQDPDGGEVENGLRALARIRQEWDACEKEPEPVVSSKVGSKELEEAEQETERTPSALKVMIPTAHYNQDVLREWAAWLGVPASNFVPKGNSPDGALWEGHLLLTASRLRQEILFRTVLPALPPWRCPVVRVLPGTVLAQGLLKLEVNGREFQTQKSKQGRFLAVLLRSAGDAVSYEEIDRFVAGGPATENTRKQWLKNVREKIRQEWLGVEPDDSGRPELEVLETVEGGLVLHAFVER